MMVSPEWYYEEYLKGKTAAEIMTKIRSLKKEIGHLKRILEDPSYPNREWAIHPSESVQLSCTKQYLEYAKKALAEAGGAYPLSQTDIKVASFNERLVSLKQLDFRVFEFLGQSSAKTITIEPDVLVLSQEELFYPDGIDSVEYQCEASDFIRMLQSFELGGWRRKYDTYRYGMVVMDGTSWELKLVFSDGSPSVRFTGDNAFPYNYTELVEYLDDLWSEGFENAISQIKE